MQEFAIGKVAIVTVSGSAKRTKTDESGEFGLLQVEINAVKVASRVCMVGTDSLQDCRIRHCS
jgi:hypothetical protein